MDRIRRYYRPLYILLAAGFFLLMLSSYIPVVYAQFHLKQYMRFPAGGETMLKGIFAVLLTGTLLLYKRPRLPEVSDLVWTFVFCVSFVPEIIMFLYSGGMSYLAYPLFYALFLLVTGRFPDSAHQGEGSIRPFPFLYRYRLMFLLVLCSAGLLAFFIRYGLQVDLSLLLLGDVYGVRGSFLATATPFLGYLKNPLLRVFLPLLLLDALEGKRYALALSAFAGAIYLYLVTAVKTDLLGIFLILFFWLIRRIPFKSLILLAGLNAAALLSISQAALTGTASLYEFLLRRALFVPAMLNRIYLLTFEHRPLYWDPEKLNELLGGTGLPSVQRYIGEVVLQTRGVNASSGILTDALINGGYAALLLPFGLMLGFAAFLHFGRFPVAYSGFPILFLFIMNSSFMGPLLLTHGLAAFFLCTVWFVPRLEQSPGRTAATGALEGFASTD